MDKITKVSNFSDVDLNNSDHHLIVRVLKTWRRASFNNPRQPYSMELILLDQQDNRITGSCLARYLYRFEPFFVEQRVLSIRRPMFGESVGPWRFVENPLKVGFNTDTVVADVNQWSGTQNGFSFTDFGSILDMTATTNLSIDVIGMVVSSSSKKYSKNKKGEDSVRVTIKLQDLNGRQIWVTLFDTYCDQICNYICQNLEMQRFVVVVQFAKFGIYNGRHSVTNAFGGTKLFINSVDVGEITTFRERFDDIYADQADDMIGSISTNITYTVENDFLYATDFMQTAEVHSVREHKYVILLATIKVIDGNWSYEACVVCNKMVQTKENKGKQIINEVDNTEGDHQLAIVTPTSLDCVDELFFCKNVECGEFEREVKTFKRFKVTLRVQDSSGTVDLTMLDSEAKRLLRKTALDVVLPSPSKDVDGRVKLPKELEALIDRKYAFKVEVSDFNIMNNYNVYTIVKTCDDQAIIGALDKKNNLTQSSYGVSLDDNVTPNSVNNELLLTKVIKDGEGVKRNLDAVYDNDEAAMSSSGKTRSTASGKSSSSTSASPVFVTPKIEK